MSPSDSDLPAALRRTAASLVAEKGAGAFSLREVARRTGVSHAAPGHHYGNSRGLLTAVAIEGFELLAESLESAARPDFSPEERLTRLGQAYVRCATSHPGHFAIMTRDDLTDHQDPRLLTASLRAFSALLATVQVVADAVNPDLNVERAALLCWSLMEGLVAIEAHFEHLDDLEMISPVPVDTLIAQFSTLIIDGFRSR